ncbi:DUF805 domain-containing protein [Planctomycetota bacterium]
MTIQNCHNCGQIIGNLQEPFSFQGNVVCKACKILLENESQAIGAIDSNAKTEIPTAEILPDGAVTKLESTADLIQQNEQARELWRQEPDDNAVFKAANEDIEEYPTEIQDVIKKEAELRRKLKQIETEEMKRRSRKKKNYGGIHRTGYFFGMLGVTVIYGILVAAARGEPGAALLGQIIVLAVSFILLANRLHNIGKSGWMSLLILVPFANLYIWIICSVCPEGYHDTKKLDTAGKIIAGIFIGLVVLYLVIVIGGFSS